MLHLETVEPGTFTLLNELMDLEALKAFSLVGETSLSLVYGHRISEDLDLSTNQHFENSEIIKSLQSKFGSRFVMEAKPAFFGVFCYINDIKVDIVRLPHPQIRPGKVIDGIRMYAPEDIVAMKIQAVLGRGKKKDFWDVAELLGHFSMDDFIQLHKEKYSNQNLYITVPQAITYFDDAEDSEAPVSLKGQTWNSVKERIQSKVRAYLM